MKRTIINLKRQAGLAITDLLIWGAGIILVLGIIAGFAGLATTTTNTIDYASGINNIKLCAVKAMQGTSDLTQISNINLVNVGCIPSSWVNGDNIVTPEGGAVELEAADFGSLNNNAMQMAISNVSRAQCNSIIPALADNYLAITVNGTSVLTGNNVNVETLNTTCQDNSENDLIFTFIN